MNETIKLNEDEVLISRLCKADGTSYNGFNWNLEIGAENSAPDFEKTKECGKGLHGWLRGEGIGTFCSYWDEKDFIFVLAAVREADIIKLDGKVKFPKCRIVFAGSREEGIIILSELYPGAVLVGGMKSVGDKGKVIVGDYGQATAGEYGKASAGNNGQAIAGEYDQATAGYGGQATAGYGGQATVGNGGQASAGEKGTISIQYWDSQKIKYRLASGEIGENGLLPNVMYQLNDKNKFTK